MEKRHILASGGAANYAIVADPSAHITEQYAARELAQYLERITGAGWRIVHPGRLDGALPIIVGFCPLAAMFETKRDASLGDEGFIIRSVDSGIIIAGNGPRGTLYGVYEFLERLGCRFLAADETVVPFMPELAIAPLDVREVPAFGYRYPYYRPLLEPDFAARRRSNGAAMGELHGGFLRYHAGASHSFDALIPPEKYFAEHPDYFSMCDGVRRPDKQLCLTNPGVYEVILEALRERLRRDPGNNVVSVSMNDRGGRCECPECKKLEEETGSPAGALVLLLNRLAEELENEFPDVIVGTLAYLYNRKPPKNVAPRDNVCIWLCSIECCYTHPLNECVDVYGPRVGEASFPGDLEGWGKITKLLFVWDYVNNFAHYVQPHPNLQVLAPNLKYLRDAGVRGVFEQGHCNCTNGSPALNELRFYLITKLLWNPDCDVDAAKRDFLEGYYGPAADCVAQYIAAFEDRIREGNIHMGISSPPNSDYLDDATLARAEKAMEKASALVKGNKKLELRIDRLRATLAFPRLAMRVYSGEATRAEVDGFFNEVVRLGYDHLEECMPLEKRRGYVLEMGRINNLVGGHFRDMAMEGLDKKK